MNIGLQSSIYSNHDLKTEVQVALDNKAGLGITFFDIFFDNWSPSSIPKDTIDFIHFLKDKNELEFTVHLPINFFEYDFVEKQIFYQFLISIKPKTITIHFDTLSYEFLEDLVNIAEDSNSILCIENANSGLHTIYGINYFEYLKNAKKQMEYSGKVNNIAATFDIGNACVHGEDPCESLEKLKENKIKIQTVHLHDNNGKSEKHLPLGNGTIDFKTVFCKIRELDINPYFVIEHWENFPQSINFLRKNF
ncbi:MAG: sugar phosphate isomerase/epimerase family protein [Treponemataceae bacterium]